MQSGEGQVDPGQTQRSKLETQPVPRTGAVAVEIYDQVYHLRGIDPELIARLAKTVDEKMRAVAAHGSTVDSLRVAVLASLNIADELTMLRDHRDEIEEGKEEERQAQEQIRRSHEQLKQSHEQLRQSHEALRQSFEQLRQSHEALRLSYNQLAGSISTTQNSMRSRSASLSGMLDELLNTDAPEQRVS